MSAARGNSTSCTIRRRRSWRGWRARPGSSGWGISPRSGPIRPRRRAMPAPKRAAHRAARARFLSLLPNPPLTPDQVEMLKRDNVVAAGALDLRTLGIAPTAVEAIIPTYLDRFRKGGWYARRRAVA